MWKEIKLDGKGLAKGRNGYFIPRKLELFTDARGEFTLWVWSKRMDRKEPVSLRVSKADAGELARQLRSLLKGEGK